MSETRREERRMEELCSFCVGLRRKNWTPNILGFIDQISSASFKASGEGRMCSLPSRANRLRSLLFYDCCTLFYAKQHRDVVVCLIYMSQLYSVPTLSGCLSSLSLTRRWLRYAIGRGKVFLRRDDASAKIYCRTSGSNKACYISQVATFEAEK